LWIIASSVPALGQMEEQARTPAYLT